MSEQVLGGAYLVRPMYGNGRGPGAAEFVWAHLPPEGLARALVGKVVVGTPAKASTLWL